jgi:Domain of unknown function (DUF1707)
VAYGPAQVPGSVLPAAAGPASKWLASTADRERAVDVLRAAFAEGRLTQDEFNDRMAQAYASRTYGELGELTADLPVGPLGILPPGGVSPAAPQREADSRPVASTAGLVLTALVVFTLAALVTSVAVYLHTHGYDYNGYIIGNGTHGQIQLEPAVRYLHSP